MIDENPKQLKKLIISPGSIDNKTASMQINTSDNLHQCWECNSNLCYVVKMWGVVDETHMFQVVGNRSNQVYSVREIGLMLYCGECGCFDEHYTKWFYPEEKAVMTYDELNEIERAEVEHALNQFNQKGDFTPLWKCPQIYKLKEKLLEYEKKHKIEGKKK